MTILAITAIGMAWLDFRLSIPHVVVTLATCAGVEMGVLWWRRGIVVWPASALQTGTSTALLLRVTTFEGGDPWSWHGWYYYVAIGGAGVASKFVVRWGGRHVFNPSNLALIVAFLVLGSGRIEPLDFWWGPMGWDLVAAYAVILVGGLAICGRLRLLELGLAFWAAYAVGVGVLAVMGQSITARWSLTPVEGARFWWILVFSPETLVFLFFMITDPRTTPLGRRARIGFGVGVGALSAVLLAPWPTEFGAKVGFLSGLLAMCLLWPLIARLRTEEWHLPPLSRPARWSAALVSSAVFAVAVGLAGGPNRGVALADPPPPPTGVAPLDQALPVVEIDANVRGLSAELATRAGAQELAATLLFNLEVEAEAMRTGNATLLESIADGQRLLDVRAEIEAMADGARTYRSFRFDELRLSIVYPGGLQRGANAGLTATGTVSTFTVDGGTRPTLVGSEPIEMMFSLRQTTSGRWVTTATPPVASAS